MDLQLKPDLPTKLPHQQLQAPIIAGLLIAFSAQSAPAAQPPSGKNGDLDAATPEATVNEGEEHEPTESRAIPRQTHERPRTLSAVREQQYRRGRLQVADSDEEPLGTYYTALLAAVEQHWYDLLEGMRVMPHLGRVELEFSLHSDGRVSGMMITDGQDNVLFGLLCQGAVLDPAPYDPWPPPLRRALGTNQNRVTITFYHQGGTFNSSRFKVRREGTHISCDVSYPPRELPKMARSSPTAFPYSWLRTPRFGGGPLWYETYGYHSSHRKKHGNSVWCKPPKNDFPHCKDPLSRPPKFSVPQRLP